MSRGYLIVAILSALLSSACMEEMEPVSLINKFRVMAVQADPPEIRPGESTTHRVLFSDPKGKGREIQVVWFTCLGQLSMSSALADAAGMGEDTDTSSVMAEETCEFLGGTFGLAKGNVAEYRVPGVPEDVLKNLKEDERFAYATTVVMLCAGGHFPEDLEDVSGGFTADTELCIGGDALMALKTFRISNQDDTLRNRNPLIDTMALDKTPLAEILEETEGTATAGRFVCENTEKCMKGVKLKARLTNDSYQSYEEVKLKVARIVEEDPYISWFVTGGDVQVDSSSASTSSKDIETRWHPPLDGGRFTLYAVAHDIRGGTSWKKYTIEAVTAQ